MVCKDVVTDDWHFFRTDRNGLLRQVYMCVYVSEGVCVGGLGLGGGSELELA